MKRKGSLVATESVSVDAVKLKFELLEKYKDLYQSMGLYEEHKLKINSYILAVAKDGAAGRMYPRSKKLSPDDVIKEADALGYQHVEHTFEPVFDEHSKVLILGSFPSVKSREEGFYYGHPAEPVLASAGETDRGRDPGNDRREEDVVVETSDRYLGCGTQL